MGKQVIIIGGDATGRKLAETIQASLKGVQIVVIDSMSAIEKPQDSFLEFPDQDMQKIIKAVRHVGVPGHKSKFHS